jgi:hypothetical protein
MCVASEVTPLRLYDLQVAARHELVPRRNTNVKTSEENPHERHRKYQSETRVDSQSVDEYFCKSFKRRYRKPGSLPH